MSLTLLLVDPEASPFALVNQLIAAYKEDWLTFDFEFLMELLAEEQKIPSVNPIVREKIRALRVCSRTAAPYHRFEVFSAVVRALLGYVVDFSQHLCLHPHEIAFGVEVLRKLRSEEFGEEVEKYIAAVLMTHGLHIIPLPQLAMAQKHLRPYDASAQVVFNKIAALTPGEVTLQPDNGDNTQALIAKAEAVAFADLVQKWQQ